MAKKILVVDDDLDILKVIKLHLDSGGFETIVAADGEKAFALVEKMKPDLIIADLLMPNLNGWWLAKKLKEDPQYKKIPMIMLSALLTNDSPPAERELGDYYMAKPVKFEKLLEKIREFLNKSKS